MTLSPSEFLSTLVERGFIDNCTGSDGLTQLLNEAGKPVPVYIGFDCTAQSLHVGSLLQIMTLRHVQRHGHKPIVLMGGGTTKVGDPSGKDQSRQLLDEASIRRNMASIQQVFATYLTFETQFDPASPHAFMVNNEDWLRELNYIDFLRDIGRHFSINKMLTFDSVKQRLEREQHLSFLEFNYMILQAYDFTELWKLYGCRVQCGGSDQWGNIVSGIELQRRLGRKEELFGLTTPLLTTAGGAKMGKTAQGAIWLDATLTSPYDFWQYWRNTHDADVIKFLKLFTELPLETIASYQTLTGEDINRAKAALANEVTTLLHGSEAAEKAQETAVATFRDGSAGEDLPSIVMTKDDLERGLPVYKAFMETGLSASGGEARRLVKGGGARLNDEKIESAERLITFADLQHSGVIKLSAGKKRHALIKCDG